MLTGQSIIALVLVSLVPLIKGTVGNVHLSQCLFDAQRGFLDHPDDLHLLRLRVLHLDLPPDLVHF